MWGRQTSKTDGVGPSGGQLSDGAHFWKRRRIWARREVWSTPVGTGEPSFLCCCGSRCLGVNGVCYRAGHLKLRVLKTWTRTWLGTEGVQEETLLKIRICFWGKGYELPDFSWPGSHPYLFCTLGGVSCSHVYQQLGQGREKVLTLKDWVA